VLEKEVHLLRQDVARVYEKLDEINTTLATAKGGWRTLMMIGGAAGARDCDHQPSHPVDSPQVIFAPPRRIASSLQEDRMGNTHWQGLTRTRHLLGVRNPYD